MNPEQKIKHIMLTDHMDIWTAADTEKKSGRGRSSSNAASVYGIKKLRELILELAVRGKLVPQDSKDEPASELIKRIQTEKAKLIAEGKIKKDKPLPLITDEDKPFDFPHGWVCVRLADIVNVLNGRAYKKEELLESGTPVLRVGNLFTSEHWYYSDLVLETDKYCNKGDLLFAWSASFGPFIWDGDKAIYHYHIWKLDLYGGDLLYKRFLYTFLLEQTQKIKASGHGVMMIHMTKEKMEKLVVYLPPLAEQHRIVAKVDELMALCDQLETQHNNAAEAHEKLVSHLLGTLTQSKSADELAARDGGNAENAGAIFGEANWQRIAAHFDTLFTTESSIDTLKQTILHLAVMGKLVPQNPNDEPAETFYRKRMEFPRGYVRSNKQAIKGVSPISTGALPRIPESWTYRSVDNLYETNHILDYADGNHGSMYPRKEDFGSEGVLFLTAAQITNMGCIDWENCPRLGREKANQLTKGWSTEGDVYFTHNATVGRTAIAELCPEDSFLLGTSVTFYRINDGSIHPRYLYLYFSSSSWFSQADAVMRQTTRNQVSITKQALFYVALPPLQEQRRIVEMVDQLFPLLEQLRRGIKEAQTTQIHLADAIVKQAIA